jgi:hypothetical protein
MMDRSSDDIDEKRIFCFPPYRIGDLPLVTQSISLEGIRFKEVQKYFFRASSSIEERLWNFSQHDIFHRA